MKIKEYFNSIYKYFRRIFLYPILIFIFLFTISIILVNIIRTPSLDRDWNTDQAIMPEVIFGTDSDENLVTIKNIRNFSYTSTTEYTPAYYDKTFDLNKIVRVWFVVEPFSGIPGSAHTLLSFEFEDDQFVAISVEIRKEKGEKYHPVTGLFANYELMYVIANERDVIKLRSNYRKDQVYLYPAKADKEKVRALFLEMLQRADQLSKKPEFYNTITNTCTTNIVAHVNTVTPKRVPMFNLRVLLPANADKLAYEVGLLDTDLSFERARMKYQINERAEKYADSEDFSVKIRE